MHPFMHGNSHHLHKCKGVKVLTSAPVRARCQQGLYWDKAGYRPPWFWGTWGGRGGEGLRLIVEADVWATSASRKHLSIHIYLNLENLRK